MLIGIYKITNTANGKVYIGQSVNLGQRWTVHKAMAKKKEGKMYLHNAIRKYGPMLFEYKIIEECERAKLDEREIYWIAYYDATNPEKGYNQTLGGHYKIISTDMNEEVLKNITEELKDNKLTMKKIGDKYNMCEDTICSINVGRRWYRDGIDYPIRTFRVQNAHITKELLIEKLKEFKRFIPVAAYFEVSETTIKSHCRKHGIPTAQRDLPNYFANLDK